MKLYVGKLAFSTDETSLKGHFGQFAPSSVQIIMDKITGRSRGFGFVEIQDSAQATQAIQSLNDSTLDGRTIVVSEARERQEGGRGSFNSGPRQGGGFRSDRGGFRSSSW